jgi:hypothetical protein
MNKNKERKNTTSLNVNWPKTPYFTIEDVFAANKNAKPITLRVRLTKEIENGRAGEIGYITGLQGRPRKVFAFTPISQVMLDSTKSRQIILVEENRLAKLKIAPMVAAFVPKPTVKSELLPV